MIVPSVGTSAQKLWPLPTGRNGAVPSAKICLSAASSLATANVFGVARCMPDQFDQFTRPAGAAGISGVNPARTKSFAPQFKCSPAGTTTAAAVPPKIIALREIALRESAITFPRWT
jgi:hypothetical protein